MIGYIYFEFKIIYNEVGDNMDYTKLSLQEKIGQKFIFGINSDNIDVIVNLIEKYYIGGVILYKDNYNSYDEMLSVIKRLKNANRMNKIPLFIAIDQEGGRVNRMPKEFSNLKNIYDMSKKDKSLIERNAMITGKMLRETGINMNFAPVMDIYENGCGKVLYNRCFYGDVDDVSELGMKYIKGMEDNLVIPVMKHFPGHGATKIDSHFLIPYIYDYRRVLDKHIKPFEIILENKDVNVDALMVNHMVIRKLTDGLPASISRKFIKEYLRDKNNYVGLVITDEINMLSRSLIYRFKYIEKAIDAGSDIILVKIKNDGEKIINKCMKIISENREYLKMLDESVERIIRVKEKYNIWDDVNYSGSNIDEINKEIDAINKICNR